MEESRVFRFQKPQWLNNASTRVAGVYFAGALFSIGFFLFVDAATLSKSAVNGSTVHLSFVDWIPGICSSLGMIVVNAIDKARLSGDSWNYNDNGVAWKARVVLFLGFALMAGGVAGSATVATLKYVVPGYPFPTLWFGVANICANVLIMLSAAVLWIVENIEDDYQYNLAL